MENLLQDDNQLRKLLDLLWSLIDEDNVEVKIEFALFPLL